jgi:predicted outer membrane repeat protein
LCAHVRAQNNRARDGGAIFATGNRTAISFSGSSIETNRADRNGGALYAGP